MASPDKQTYVVVDADTLAGWRRVTSSLAQLHEAVDHLRKQEPDAMIAVIGDPGLKWALNEIEQDEIELDIRTQQIVLAPAGCIGGHKGYIGEIVRRASHKGYKPVVVTDQAVPDAKLARIRRDGLRWVFDLDAAVAPTIVASNASAHGHRRRR